MIIQNLLDKQIEKLLDDNPDAQAIVFANDEMAFAGYRVCEKRGLKVGKDILITGFDDCERASGMEPPLTTIQQDGVLMGRMAVYDLVDKLDGKKCPVPKSSCFSVCQRILRLPGTASGNSQYSSKSYRTDTQAEPDDYPYEA